jgi:hypothetical protein
VRSLRYLATALAAGALVTPALAGCSGSGTAVHGVTPGATQAQGAAPSGSGSGATGPAGATGGATAGGPGGAGAAGPAKAANPCDTKAFAVHAGLATGAVHQYVTRPYSAGALAGAPNPARSTAALASAFADRQLRLAVAAVRTCPTARSLVSVTGQNAAFFGSLSARLTGSDTPARQLRAADPLLADVASQAGRLKVTLVVAVPTPAQLRT